MAKKNGAERIRLNLALTPTVKDRLERLLENSEAESVSEVVRRSLAVYEELLAIRREGSRLIVEGPDGRTEALRIL